MVKIAVTREEETYVRQCFLLCHCILLFYGPHYANPSGDIVVPIVILSIRSQFMYVGIIKYTYFHKVSNTWISLSMGFNQLILWFPSLLLGSDAYMFKCRDVFINNLNQLTVWSPVLFGSGTYMFKCTEMFPSTT